MVRKKWGGGGDSIRTVTTRKVVPLLLSSSTMFLYFVLGYLVIQSIKISSTSPFSPLFLKRVLTTWNVCCSNIVNNSEDGELLSMMEYLASARTAPTAVGLFYCCGRRRQRAS